MNNIKILTIALMLNITSYGATLKETIVVGIAGGSICKTYAEQVNGDVDAFTNVNVMAIKVAEKMGYTDNLVTFNNEVKQTKNLLEKELKNKYRSKKDAYNDWCVRFYNGFQKGFNSATGN